MKIGDKIRFLSSTGGGIVKSFQGKDLAIVEDEDGFEIPVLIRECVVIDPANENQVRQSVKPKSIDQSITYQKEPEIKSVEIVETKEGELITACLAYLPLDVKNLTTTNYECYLVNDSNYFLSYIYASRANAGWLERASGVIEPNTKIFLEEFDKTQINDLEKISVQFIAYKKEKPFRLKNPCSVEINIDTVKFYKLHSFKENDYFEDEAIIYPIMKNDLPNQKIAISSEAIELAMKTKNDSSRARIQPIDKKNAHPVLEIDLHINELLDSTAGLEAKDMLEYQIAKFKEVMEENKNNKGQKIVFIHGKGDGILKTTILKELKAKYKSAYCQDASFREYGFGATMITIR